MDAKIRLKTFSIAIERAQDERLLNKVRKMQEGI
jgi:hypothetical protein